MTCLVVCIGSVYLFLYHQYSKTGIAGSLLGLALTDHAVRCPGSRAVSSRAGPVYSPDRTATQSWPATSDVVPFLSSGCDDNDSPRRQRVVHLTSCADVTRAPACSASVKVSVKKLVSLKRSVRVTVTNRTSKRHRSLLRGHVMGLFRLRPSTVIISTEFEFDKIICS